jgi:hypothetical protein
MLGAINYGKTKSLGAKAHWCTSREFSCPPARRSPVFLKVDFKAKKRPQFLRSFLILIL